MEKSTFNKYKSYTQAEIVEAVKSCVNNLSPNIKPTKSLTNMVYFILKAYFVDGKRFVIANAPTGSGKTIIGFMVHFCIQYLETKKVRPNESDVSSTSYFLTSNKILQDQIENDIDRFSFEDYLVMLKGIDNYPCSVQTKLFNENEEYKQSILRQQPEATFASYRFRKTCKNMKAESIENLECYSDCGYRNKRFEASTKPCTILNYAYFLNVFRDKNFENPNKHFYPRTLTICDEAHLLPDIVCNMFNYEFTAMACSQIFKFVQDFSMQFGWKDSMDNYQESINKCLDFFKYPVNRVSEFLIFTENLGKLKNKLKEIKTEYSKSESFKQMYGDRFDELLDKLEIDNLELLNKLVNERPNDIFYTSEKGEQGLYYKHILKDLSEQNMVRHNFIDCLEYGLFMSATLGDMDEYAQMLGLEDNEYTTLFLPSTFDFSRSPIYMCKSGYLNYANFNNNIDKVLLDTINVCNRHRNEKGVIHTSTFKIADMLKDKILSMPHAIDIDRFLFYRTTQEKEKLIEQFTNSTIPYILVGPSLYEGIDLPDDKCRFQCLIKVPYAALSDYIKAKMKRIPFWYKRNCIEKIIQAIGRSNRHKNDYSTIYLMDSSFDNIIFDTNDEIIERLETKRIY